MGREPERGWEQASDTRCGQQAEADTLGRASEGGSVLCQVSTMRPGNSGSLTGPRGRGGFSGSCISRPTRTPCLACDDACKRFCAQAFFTEITLTEKTNMEQSPPASRSCPPIRPSASARSPGSTPAGSVPRRKRNSTKKPCPRDRQAGLELQTISGRRWTQPEHLAAFRAAEF